MRLVVYNADKCEVVGDVTFSASTDQFAQRLQLPKCWLQVFCRYGEHLAVGQTPLSGREACPNPRCLAQAAGHADHPREKLSLESSPHLSDPDTFGLRRLLTKQGLTEGCQRGSIQKADGLRLDVLGPAPLAFQTTFQCGAEGAMVQERKAILPSRCQDRPRDFMRVQAVQATRPRGRSACALLHRSGHWGLYSRRSLPPPEAEREDREGEKLRSWLFLFCVPQDRPLGARPRLPGSEDGSGKGLQCDASQRAPKINSASRLSPRRWLELAPWLPGRTGAVKVLVNGLGRHRPTASASPAHWRCRTIRRLAASASPFR